MSAGRYLAAAFNARPLGMPIPPNWFGLAAFGLLGGLLNPGFWLIGSGLELAYLFLLARNRRFQAAVDAGRSPPGDPWATRRAGLVEQLDFEARRAQEALEARCVEISNRLDRLEAGEVQRGQLAQLCWLHLKLLTARGALAEVVASAGRERERLAAQRRELEERLANQDLDPELRGSLEDQLQVIHGRRQAHADADRRLQIVDAELERIRQQVALLREQTLLASDSAGLARSVDVLAASMGEASRWLKDQGELFAALDDLGEPPPMDTFLGPKGRERGREQQ